MEREFLRKKQQEDQIKIKLNDVKKLAAEANESAKLLKRDVEFSVQLISEDSDQLALTSKPVDDIKNRKFSIKVKVSSKGLTLSG